MCLLIFNPDVPAHHHFTLKSTRMKYIERGPQHPIFTYHPQIMETSTFTIFRAILLCGTSSSSSSQADISALTEQEAKVLLLQMAKREPGLLFDIMRQNTPRTVGSAVAANWSLSRNDQWCRTIMLQHAA